MLSLFTPHLHVPNVFALTRDRLRALGLSALLLDLDCTLKDYHAKAISSDVQQWCETLKADGIRLSLFSNGGSRRVAKLAATLGIDFIAAACKPLPFRCSRQVRTWELPKRSIAVVGDQLFADVLAGRLAGLFTILVTPTTDQEPWLTSLKRLPNAAS